MKVKILIADLELEAEGSEDAIRSVFEAVRLMMDAEGEPISAAARGSMGGRARAAKMTPERRKEIATKAAKARWG